MVRLNKVLAGAGLASRRGADRLILEGRVTVNGRRITELGLQIDPETDAVKVDGKRVHPSGPGRLYLALNKPAGYVTTLSDPEGRSTVADLLPPGRRRLFPVGRLDYATEGLLLVTDDGDLARDLTHPSSGTPKTYLTKLRGRPDSAVIERLSGGIVLDGRTTAPAQVRLTKPGRNSWIELTITEGRKHQVRRMCAAVGHPVLRLRRIAFAGIQLGDLAPGKTRPLTQRELRRLRQRRGAGRG